MLFQLKTYLKFLWKSNNEHGVHSPFVFNLLTQCFYDKKKYTEYEILEKYRKTLLQNKNIIEVTDFGAGSRIFNSNKRPIHQIAKTAGISKQRAKLLFRMIHYFQPNTILELGTSLGLGTIALSLGNSKTKIKSLEGCAATAHIAKNQLDKYNSKNVELINSEFLDYLSSLNLNTKFFDLIYFDGNHSQEATLTYFELLLSTQSNESVWIFDDIHWSKDMENTWKIIKNHPKVTVTIDTFQWGIVFFRKEQEKEHFVIRI